MSVAKYVIGSLVGPLAIGFVVGFAVLLIDNAETSGFPDAKVVCWWVSFLSFTIGYIDGRLRPNSFD